MDKYNVYTSQDFLDDMDFVRHIKYPMRAQSQELRVWRNANPENAKAYDEARAYLKDVLAVQRIVPGTDFTEHLLADINTGINQYERGQRWRTLRMRIAAVAASLLIISGSLYWYFNAMITVNTGSGELKVVYLPDNSTVQLNANSSISYYRSWRFRSVREVFTTGELLFDVKHLNTNPSEIHFAEQFVAHSGNIVVEVLGTTFNIKNRDARIEVSLLKGKIALKNSTQPDFLKILQPGDIVAFVNQQFVNTTSDMKEIKEKTVWTEKKMVAENLSVQDLIREFHYIYGKEIVVTDTSLLHKRIDGKISLASADNIIYSLANILQADIEIQKDTIYLKPKKLNIN